MDTFATLVNRKLVVPSLKTSYLAIERDFLVEIMRPLVAQIRFDEAWYLASSPDVGDAVRRGDFTSAADHFCRVGFYEHRMPYDIDVDEAWYLESYPDIAQAVRGGIFASGREHFREQGYREGRFPHADFALFNGDAAALTPALMARGRKPARAAQTSRSL